MKVRLTTDRVERAEPPPGARSVYLWDTDLKGFGLLVRRRATGPPSRTYVIRYGTGRRGKGKTPFIGQHGQSWRPHPITGEDQTLNLELARAEANRLLGQRVDGQDPAAARRARGPRTMTLGEFWDIFETDWADVELAPGTREKVRSAWARHLSKWGGRLQLDQVDAREVTQLKKAMKDVPVQFNRCRSYLSKMLAQARVWGYVPRGWPNACQDVPKYDEVEREQSISVEQLARVGRAMAQLVERHATKRGDREEGEEGAVSPVVAAAIRFLMATGARPVEILGIKREAVPSAIAAGQIVRHSAKVGKRRRKRRPVYLNPIANAILENAPPRPANPYVFPGRRAGQHLTIWALDAAWERIRELAGGVDGVRLLDATRHAFATIAATLGEPKLVQDLLGHADFKTTQRYIHIGADPLRALSGKTAAALDDALRGEKKD